MDRRAVITDAAIALIADAGIRALTHRALDASAGLPDGSTSYYFRTKADLVSGVSTRLVEVSRATHLGLLDDDPATSISLYLADVLTHRMHHLRARYALSLDPNVDADTRAMLAGSFFSIERAEALFLEPAHAEGLVSLCEGLLADVVFGHRTFDDAAALRIPIAAYLAGSQSVRMKPDS